MPQPPESPRWVFDALPPSGQRRGGDPSEYAFTRTLDTFVREALQNANKHAGADAEISIVVTEQPGLLVFEVRDDGLGFTPDPNGDGGHGFVNMIDRLGTVRGKLKVDSWPGKGTLIRGEISLD